MRTFQTLEKATSLAPSRPVRLERAACQRRRVGVQGWRVRAAAREQLLHSLRRTCALFGTWTRFRTRPAQMWVERVRNGACVANRS